MANRRMISNLVVDTDRFLDMPPKAQALYFHLNLAGDDDGFVASPKKLCRAVCCSKKDLRTLEEAGYILSFPSGVICIVDWCINNTLRNDRYTPTVYQKEFAMLEQDSNGRYFLREEQETEELEEHTYQEETITAETSLETGRNQAGTTLEPAWNQAGTNLDPQHNLTKHNLVYESVAKPNEDYLGRASPSPRAFFLSYA